MKVNFSDVRYIVSWGAARSLLDQHKEAGRDGRDGELSHVVIIYHGNQLAHCEDDVKGFVKAEGCLRVAAYKPFDANVKPLKPYHNCCSNCAKTCDCSAGMIWLLIALSDTILPTIVPYFFDRLSPLHIILALFPLAVGGLLALQLGRRTVWHIYLSVAMFGIIQTLMEITSVSLTAYFDVVTVKYYCVGTGFGYVIGTFHYTAMTSWLHISSDTIISAVVIFHSVVFLLCYLLLENRRETSTGYQIIAKDSEQQQYEQNDIRQNLSISEKLHTAVEILPKVMQILLGILFHDLVLSGITTTIAFPGSPFSPSDHYKYYLIMSFAGLCLGRSYLGIAAYMCPGLSDMLLIRRTWALVVIAGFHVVLLVFDSLYRFIPNVWLILLLVFSLGFWAEAIYLNVNVTLGEIQDFRARELSMGLAVFGIGVGALVGAIISGPMEHALVQHCLQSVNQTSFCLTREVQTQGHYD